MNKFVHINRLSGPGSSIVSTHIKNGLILTDTHQAWNNGTFIVPMDGVYQINTSTYGPGGSGQGSVQSRPMKAGEILTFDDMLVFPQVGDWLVINNETLVEVTFINNNDETIEGLVKDTKVDLYNNDEYFNFDVFHKNTYKIVPKDTNLDTYILLYGK